MEAWIAILIALLPPLVLAALQPHTENWRRARKRFWIVSALAATLVAVCVALHKVFGPGVLAGPAAVWMGALFVFAVVMAVWLHALETVRSERREWRGQHKGKEIVVGVPGIDPTKPWKM